MMIRLTFWLMLLLILPACKKESDPVKFVTEFYTVCLKEKPRGLPSDDQLMKLSPFLSEQLIVLFINAKNDQRKFIKDYPDEKPPLIEGDLFSSLFEGPGEFQVSHRETHGDSLRIFVNFSYSDPEHPGDIFQWTDAVILEKRNDSFMIVNIEFSGDWPFKTGNDLLGIIEHMGE